MELNGIANISAIIEMAKWDKKIDDKTYAEIHQQLDILEVYMKDVHKALKANQPVPKWHEVKQKLNVR